MTDTQILWGQDKIFILDKIPQKKIDRALGLVNRCLSGETGFCFRQVRKYPLASGTGVRDKIKELKTERMNPATSKERGDKITVGLKKLREVEKGYYLFDSKTQRTLKAVRDRLHRALVLLVGEGEVESFSLDGFGRLVVNWWTERGKIQIEEIHQGWTYFYNQQSGFQPRAQLSKNMWSTYGMVTPFKSEGILEKNKSEIVGQGKINPRYVGRKAQGAGEYDSFICTDIGRGHSEVIPAKHLDIRSLGMPDKPRF